MNKYTFNLGVYSLLEKICVCCLNESNDLKSIINSAEDGQDDSDCRDDNVNLGELTQTLIGIDFTLLNQCPSPQICSCCLKKLLACYEFRQQCLESLEQLQNIKMQTESEDEEEYLVEESDDTDDKLNVSEVIIKTKIDEWNMEEVNHIVDNVENEFNPLENYLEIDKLEKDDHQEPVITIDIERLRIEKDGKIYEPKRLKYGFWQCPICKCIKTNIKRHLKTHINHALKNQIESPKAGKNIKRKTCPICCEPRQRLLKHIRTHSTEQHNLLREIKTKLEKGDILPVPAICELCGQQSNNILHHLQTLHIGPDSKTDFGEPHEICYICGLNVPRLQHHLISHDINRVSCDLCQKTFTDKKGLRVHMKIHLNKREYKCKICPAAFNVFKSLRVHTNMHNNDRKHKCEYCGMGFLEACHLTRHVRVKHIRSYDLKCRYCDKMFYEQSVRRVHEQCHIKHEYPCKFCPKILTSKPSYYQHIRLHIKKNPITCEICNLKFYRIMDHTKHMRLHEYEQM